MATHTTFQTLLENHYRRKKTLKADIQTSLKRGKTNLAGLAGLGIDLGAVTEQLEKEGVKKFTEAFIALLENLRQRLKRGDRMVDAKMSMEQNG